MLHLAVILLLSPCLMSYVQGQKTVFLYPGEIRGTTMVTRNGRNISAFLGIPYAKPPVGPLRFKNPQPLDMKNRVIMADKDGERCPQLNEDGDVVGDEDCLFLNVYAPSTMPSIPYPTMVYFHGGDFVKGSGSSVDAGPEYLMDRDIVLVTVNYRLGVLGFLCTGDSVVPGNFGLKDQVLALKWVQNNILSFLGNPGKVTIFGQGAGGASTSLHAVTNVTEGLFDQYISQSGNIMPFWVHHYRDSYQNRSVQLGEYLNCPTDNSRNLVDCLRNVDTRSLVDSNDIFADEFWVFDTWGPVTEVESLGAYLTYDPVWQARIWTDVVRDIPAMLGNVVDEGLILTAHFQTDNTIWDRISEDVFGFLVYMMELFLYNSNPTFAAKMVQTYYFNNTGPSDKQAFTRRMTSLITDIGFVLPLHYQMRSMIDSNRTSPLYLYSFNYRGTYSTTFDTTGNNENIGVTHGDDLIYLFPAKKLFDNLDFQLSDSDETMIDIMVDLWTSFADTGIPMTNSTSDPKIWEAYDNNTMNNLKIGHMSDAVLSTQYELHNDKFKTWAAMIASYNSYLYTNFL